MMLNLIANNQNLPKPFLGGNLPCGRISMALKQWQAFLNDENISLRARRHPQLLSALMQRCGASSLSPQQKKRAQRDRLRLLHQIACEPLVRCQRQTGAVWTIAEAVMHARNTFSETEEPSRRTIAIGILEIWGCPRDDKPWSAYVTGWYIGGMHVCIFCRQSMGWWNLFATTCLILRHLQHWTDPKLTKNWRHRLNNVSGTRSPTMVPEPPFGEQRFTPVLT